MFLSSRYVNTSCNTVRVSCFNLTSTGNLEVDYDAEGWADWDEDVHGPMDTDQNREEYPENFEWTCCGEAGDNESGCEDCPHTY